jgi:hypothetical protein
MSEHQRSVLDLDRAFSAERDRTAHMDSLATEIACTRVLTEYILKGGPINVLKNFAATEAEYILSQTGIFGLDIYIILGGEFSPDFRDKDGNNELMRLLSCGSYKIKPDILKTFVKNGGRFNSHHRNKANSGEVISIITSCAQSNVLEALNIYMAHGGQFSSDTHCIDKQNELIMLVENKGLEGLKFFFEHGGVANPAHRSTDFIDNTPRYNEMTYIATCGLQGVKTYIENGGTFNNAPKQGELTDAMAIAISEDIEALKYFVNNGGRFFPDIKNGKNFTEAMIIADFLGKEGLDIFFEYGGTIRPTNPIILKGQKTTELSIIKRAYGGQLPEYVQKSPRAAFKNNPKFK